MSAELQEIVVIGKGGQARVVIDTLKNISKRHQVFRIVGFLDDQPKQSIFWRD